MLLSNTELHVEVRKRLFQQWACMYMGLNPILKQAGEKEEGIQLPNVSGVVLNALDSASGAHEIQEEHSCSAQDSMSTSLSSHIFSLWSICSLV